MTPWRRKRMKQAIKLLMPFALFYADWPNVFSALPVAKEVFEKRAKQTSKE